MAVILQAPLELIQTVTVLPNPQIGDNYAPRNNVNVLVSMDGTIYTYIKKLSTYKILWTFVIDYYKAFELRAFINSYHYCKWRIIDHHDRIWIGVLTSNPIEMKKVSLKKMVDDCLLEKISVSLEFEVEPV